MPSRPRRALSLSLLAAVLASASLAAPARAADPDPGAPATDRGSEAAQAALATVRDLLEGSTPTVPAAAERPSLTLALRDLALLKNDLPAAQERAAERLLARPTDPSDQYGDTYQVPERPPVCSAVVCVHYVKRSADKVPRADGDDDGVPDYVEFALRTMTHVHHAYVAAGYRPPKPDSEAPNDGGNEKPDVYLANIGDNGYYGYCATDETLPSSQPQDTWGYCVLDNDYAKAEFGTRNTPRQNFRVTAAHEYFHAVQFGYDVSEDGWVMEATATWAEDELYDTIDDNVAYLRGGPMRLPHKPLDQFSGVFHYGTWIFFRHLTEKFRYQQAGMPILVRDLWRRLDDSAGGIGDYSLEGLKTVLRQRDLSLTDAFSEFFAANRMSRRAYDEGGANHYPKAPLVSSTTLGQDRRRTGPLRVSLDHLAAGTVRYTPARTMVGGAWRLRLVLDMAARFKGTGAVITVHPRSGEPSTRSVTLNRRGNARPQVRFSTGRVKHVEVTLVNASDDFRCWRATDFSCAGRPKFDDSVQRIGARIFRAGS